jgi:Pyruvate/2-oxoacid:ferredoxin oxidoreductase delta subunit
MAVRNIVRIDEAKCNGCGQCVTACAEGAIAIIDGKARLVSEIYCDGLGACLGTCPEDAITIEHRDADAFDEKATEEHLAKKKASAVSPGGMGCPGSRAMKFAKRQGSPDEASAGPVDSELTQWPVQLSLVGPNAPYFANADLLLVADCVPFAMADFHKRFLRDHAITVGCPKLDDVEFYIEKLAAIIAKNNLNSLTVIHMQVPCCSGLTYIAKQAIARAESQLEFEDITIGLQGEVLS